MSLGYRTFAEYIQDLKDALTPPNPGSTNQFPIVLDMIKSLEKRDAEGSLTEDVLHQIRMHVLPLIGFYGGYAPLLERFKVLEHKFKKIDTGYNCEGGFRPGEIWLIGCPAQRPMWITLEQSLAEEKLIRKLGLKKPDQEPDPMDLKRILLKAQSSLMHIVPKHIREDIYKMHISAAIKKVTDIGNDHFDVQLEHLERLQLEMFQSGIIPDGSPIKDVYMAMFKEAGEKIWNARKASQPSLDEQKALFEAICEQLDGEPIGRLDNTADIQKWLALFDKAHSIVDETLRNMAIGRVFAKSMEELKNGTPPKVETQIFPPQIGLPGYLAKIVEVIGDLNKDPNQRYVDIKQVDLQLLQNLPGSADVIEARKCIATLLHLLGKRNDSDDEAKRRHEELKCMLASLAEKVCPRTEVSVKVEKATGKAVRGLDFSVHDIRARVDSLVLGQNAYTKEVYIRHLTDVLGTIARIEDSDQRFELTKEVVDEIDAKR